MFFLTNALKVGAISGRQTVGWWNVCLFWAWKSPSKPDETSFFSIPDTQCMVYVLYQVYRPHKLDKFRMIYIMEVCTSKNSPSHQIISSPLKHQAYIKLPSLVGTCFFIQHAVDLWWLNSFWLRHDQERKGLGWWKLYFLRWMGSYPHLLTLTGTMRRLSYLSRSYIHINLYLPQKEGRAHGKHVMICW